MICGSAAEDVHAHAGTGARIAHPMPPLQGWNEVGDVALVPDMAARLLELGPFTVVGKWAVTRLLVAALQVADDAPATVVVHTARRAFREHDGHDVEPSGRVGVEHVAHCLAVERLACRPGDR